MLTALQNTLNLILRFSSATCTNIGNHSMDMKFILMVQIRKFLAPINESKSYCSIHQPSNPQ